MAANDPGCSGIGDGRVYARMSFLIVIAIVPYQLRDPSRSRHLLRVVALLGDCHDQAHSASQFERRHDRWLHCPMSLLF